MTFRVRLSSAVALIIATCASAHADPTVVGHTVFATGAAVGATGADSVTTGDGSVWIEYGNGADSTGASGSSTIVRYGLNGAVQATIMIPGLVDGLKVNPVTGQVWALQNNDGNSMLSLIDPTTNTVSSTLSYAVTSTSRGYDDVAFLNGKVFLSYTNPVNPTDPVLQILNNGNNPKGTLTTTSILTAQQTGIPTPDIDSLKSTPNGKLVLTSEGDGAGSGNPIGTFTLISNPGAANQKVTNVPAKDAMGTASEAMDDVLFPDAASGTLYVTDTSSATVYAVRLEGLDPNTPIISLGNFDEVALVDPTTGVVEMPLLTAADVGGALTSPHGLEFVPGAVPEPSTWAMMLIGFAGLGYAGYRRTRKGAAVFGA